MQRNVQLPCQANPGMSKSNSGTTALDCYQYHLGITLPDVGKDSRALSACLKLAPSQRQLKAMTVLQAMLDGIEECGPSLRQPATGGLSALPDSKRQRLLPAPIAFDLLEGAQAVEGDIQTSCGQAAWQAGPATELPSLEGVGVSPCIRLCMSLIACHNINSTLLRASVAFAESVL